ncbi:NACHT domain-containing protein [Candidatus Neomarinimicrobiota bacterium]
MDKKSEAHVQAKSLSSEARKKILKSYPETKIHQILKKLYLEMEPNYSVAITHGSTELGKDLVIVKKDAIDEDVIAVIVKKGDIKGKTLGDVDEIKERISDSFKKRMPANIREIISQAEQAAMHEAELKAYYETLEVNKLYVVLVGDISNQARIRIKDEIKQQYRSIIKVFDISWLSEQLVQYYPQAFFEGEIIDFLQTKIQEIELRHYEKKRRKSLTEYFVEPMVRESGQLLDLDPDGVSLVIDDSSQSFEKLHSLLGGKAKIILVGDPGSGKSGSLAYLAINMLKEASKLVVQEKRNMTISIPVLATATEISSIKSSDGLIASFGIQDDIKSRFAVTTLMVDALDEVNHDDRCDVIDRAKELSDEIGCALVITSRKIDFVNEPPKGLKKYELLPFDIGQAIRLYKKIVSDAKRLDVLRNGLEQMEHHLQMIPLSLIMLLDIVEDNEEVPASIAELYERYFDFALGRHDKDKGIEVLFEYYIKKKFLAWLAFNHFYNENRLSISKETFLDALSIYAKQYAWNREKQTFFLEELERSGVLNIRGEVDFRHRSFLDYFAAYYVFEERSEIKDMNRFIAKLYFDDLWQDISLFYIGLRRELNSTIINYIFELAIDTLEINVQKYSIGRLLQAGWHTTDRNIRMGINLSIEKVDKIRSQFKKEMENIASDKPEILSDTYILGLTKHSFSSIFLRDQLVDIALEKLAKPSELSLRQAAVMLFACKGFIEPDDIQAAYKLYEEAIQTLSIDAAKSSDASQAFGASTKMKIDILMLLAIEPSSSIYKKINHRLEKSIKAYPEVAKKIFPKKKAGFRLKSKKIKQLKRKSHKKK